MAINIEHTRPVYQTKDYGQFVFQRGNREINRAHVAQIAQSMRIHGNLLDLYPIVVQERRRKGQKKGVFEIHDGQHRFEAARSLGLDIHYIIDGEQRLTIQTIIDANAAQKSWTLRDFLSSYCIRDFPEYLRVREYITIYPVPISIALRLLHGGSDKTLSTEFKRGRFKVQEWDWATMIGDSLLDFAQYFAGAFTKQFVAAVTMLYRNPHYEHSRMQDKLPHAHHLLVRGADVDETFARLEQLYNWKVHTKNLVQFTMIDSEGRKRMAGRWVYDPQGNGLDKASVNA